MDGIFHELSRKTDPAKLLGYLNFSDGRPDPKFQKGLADAFGVPARERRRGPVERAAALARPGARRTGSVRLAGVPRPDPGPRACSTPRSCAPGRVPRAPRRPARPPAGRRPVRPVLPRPRVRGGAAAGRAVGRPGPARRRVRSRSSTTTSATGRSRSSKRGRTPSSTRTRRSARCRSTSRARASRRASTPTCSPGARTAGEDRPGPARRSRASTPDHLDELAFDPRAHDHFHPVNKRPNVLFGEWDPHTIDNRGYYRRFVLRQMTLDTLLTWVDPATGPRRRQGRAAVRSRGGARRHDPDGRGRQRRRADYHDSIVTLSKLVPRIARYRDAFYQQLLKALPGPHGERLRDEAEKRKQPFAGVRQYLNQAIADAAGGAPPGPPARAALRRDGLPAAAREQAAKIAAPAVRFGTEIRIRQTEAGFAADRERAGRRRDAARRSRRPAPPRDRLRGAHRPVEHPRLPGAVPDLPRPRGHGPRPAGGGTDPHQIGRQFDLYAKAIAAAAVAGDEATRERLTAAMRDLAAWWDQFATAHRHRLAARRRRRTGRRGRARRRRAGGVVEARPRARTTSAFWRQHREGFTSPAAFAQVIEPLIERQRVAGRDGAAHDVALRGRHGSARRPVARRSRTSRERWVRGVAARRGRAGRGAGRARAAVLRAAGSERRRSVARAATSGSQRSRRRRGRRRRRAATSSRRPTRG